MLPPSRCCDDVSQRGVALVTVILVLFLLTVFAITFYVSATQSARMSANYRVRTEVLYIAQAGVNEAAKRLSLTQSDPNNPVAISAGGSYVEVNDIEFDAYIGDPANALKTNCQGWNKDWVARIVAGTDLPSTAGDETTTPTILPQSEWADLSYTVADAASPYVLTIRHKINSDGLIVCYTEDDELYENTSKGDPIYRVEATGWGRGMNLTGGSTTELRRTIVVDLRRRPFEPGVGILSNGKIDLNGNSMNVEASIHSNSPDNPAINIGANPTVTGTISAVGTISGDASPANEVSGADVIPIPSQDPRQYVDEASYFLDKYGYVWERKGPGDPNGPAYPGADWKALMNGGTQWRPTSSGRWNNWMSNTPDSPGTLCNSNGVNAPSTRWDIRSGGSGASWTGGTVFVDGSAEVSAGATWNGTLLVNGDLDFTGNSTSFQTTVGDVAAQASVDLKITGNSGTTLPGMWGVRGQASLAGSPVFRGSLIAEYLGGSGGVPSCSNLVNPATYGITISGTVTIISEGAMNNDGPGNYEQVSWRELDTL
jgi:Tfp pilus assembly protein PilX